jgi:DHA2 family multidrug resistance protein
MSTQATISTNTPALVPPARAARTDAAAPIEHEENKWLVSLAVIFSVLMSAIDSSVVNVALPNMQGTVGATQQEITWVSTGYLISVVILMPLTNWLSVRFGRKRIYLISLVLFTASSLMCGLSNTLPMLVFWRVVQGLGAGTLQPLAQAIFREAFPQEQQGIAMGVFGFVVLFGPAIGPTLGGWITDNYSWPWIFFINIPIGILGFFIAQAFLYDPPYMRGGRKMTVDAVGIGLLAVGLATLQTVLEQGESEDWFQSSFITTFTTISVVALAAFIWWELTFDKPAVDLRILKDFTFASGTFIGGILGVGLFASLFLLPQYIQVLLGFTATQSGLALMPRSLTMMVMMPVAGLLYNRLGARVMIGSGLLLAAYAQWIMAHFTLQTSAQDILAPQIIQGVGFGLVFVALSTAALSNIPRERMTSATGLNNLVRQLGGSFGITIIVTILSRHVTAARANLAANANVGNPAFMDRLQGFTGAFIQRGYDATTARTMALRVIDGIVSRQAAMIAYEYIFFLIGALFLVCLPLVYFLRTKRGDASTSEHMVLAE